LEALGYTYLFQVKRPMAAPSLLDDWLDSAYLSLDGPLALEWSSYTSALKGAGITLTDQPDLLLWAGGDATGSLTVKNIYFAYLLQMKLQTDHSWTSHIWNWQIPLKLKLFIWLAGKEKILSWEALRHRGWEGPGICPLCKQESEDVHHLLVHCIFTKEVWHLLTNFFPQPVDWRGPTLSACFRDCIKQKSASPSLAAHICWQIWKERNFVIFEGHPPSIQAVAHRVWANFQWQPPSNKTFAPKSCEISLPEGYSLACFDGAAASSGLCCGAGGFFKTHQKRITKWFINCGEGTNTKAELLGLWTALALAAHWSLDHLLILGDSRIIIDWINKKSELHSVQIEGWMDKTVILSKLFNNVKYQHFSRTFNKVADALSKRALSGVVGRLHIFHCENGLDSPISFINLFERTVRVR
jgi:ribonuclease HI